MEKADKTKSRSFAALLLLCSAAVPIIPAYAKNPQSKIFTSEKFDVELQAILQYIADRDSDLGTTNDDTTHSLSEQLQLSVGTDLSEYLYGYVRARGVNISGDSGFEDDTGNTNATDDTFLELRELYVKHEHLFGQAPLSLQVGRQRVKEPRSLWWNSDNDLVRLHYNSTLFNGFIAAGQNLDSYRTGSGDRDFHDEDEDKFHVLGESSWQYRMGHFLEGRFMYENDHSGIESVGTVLSSDDQDDEDQNLVWAGLRAAGEVYRPSVMVGKFEYRADIMGVAGTEDDLLTAAGPGAGLRTVTGSANRDVRAWGFDGTISLDPGMDGGVMLYAGYAYGSGDDNPAGDTDNEFRQTDLDGSSSRIGVERQPQKNYGEVLRPELSNLHVFSFGAGYPFNESVDAAVTYFNYQLAENALRLRSSNISAPLNGTDKELGQEIDIAVNVDLDDQLPLNNRYTKDIDFRIAAGGFSPGDAYEPGGNDNSYHLFAEIKFRF